MAPVGIVAAVSMKTIWKRKKQKIAMLKTEAFRKNPFPPQRPKNFPPTTIPCSEFRKASPGPSGACQPMGDGAFPYPPNMIANPKIQKPSMPSG